MILRVSGKLGKKIKVAPSDSLPRHDNPYLDWSGHVFRANGRQYIILTNTASLYSVIFPGRGITTPAAYEARVRSELRAFLDYDGVRRIYEQYIATDDGPPQFSKAFNRSVTGSMNDLVYHAQVHLEWSNLPLREAAVRINEMPMGMLDMGFPDRVFPTLLDRG